MSRRRTQSVADTGLSADLQPAFMEPPGASSRPDEDFLDVEPDEELLCSVSDITEQLGRNITVVLETALSEIRNMVSIRIRVLKMELREKTEEIQVLKARLESAQRDCRDPDPAAESGLKRSSMVDPRRSRTGLPGVKKENIDAICDYLMKDKNSRGGQDPDPDQSSDRPDSLHLWPDSGLAGAGSASGDSEDLFSMLPSGSKRMYDYEWIPPMEFSSDLKVMKEPESDNNQNTETEEDEPEEVSRRDEAGLDPVHDPLSQVQPAEFSMEPHRSPGEGRSPVEEGAERPAAGPQFPGHTYICSLCGTFCPDSVFLEEHIKLIHLDSAEALQALQSTCTAAPALTESGAEPRRVRAQAESGARPGSEPVKKEAKMEGGYECGDCGRHFNYLGNLRQHQRIHTGEKPFMCPECGERFRHAARLKSHRLVHSGAQSPFPCPQCGKGFSVLSGLKRHQRVHTGESPYACPQCGRRFKELGNLYTHQRIHSGATPYCCHTCGRSFRHLGTYKSHRCTPTQ